MCIWASVGGKEEDKSSWDTRKTRQKKKKSQMHAEKSRFRGKIYFCSKDSSFLGTVYTEQLNHPMRRLVKHNSLRQPWPAGLAEGHLREGQALQLPGGGVRLRWEGQGVCGLETNRPLGPWDRQFPSWILGMGFRHPGLLQCLCLCVVGAYTHFGGQYSWERSHGFHSFSRGSTGV